jgi:hypothetical protein
VPTAAPDEYRPSVDEVVLIVYLRCTGNWVLRNSQHSLTKLAPEHIPCTIPGSKT